MDVFAPEWLDLQNDAFILKIFVKSELFVTFIEYKVLSHTTAIFGVKLKSSI